MMSRAVADAVVVEHRAAEVAQHDLAALDHARARLVVRAGRVGAGGHDGEVHAVVALGEEPPADVGRHLGLGAADERDLAAPAAAAATRSAAAPARRSAAISAASFTARSGPMTSLRLARSVPPAARLQVDEEPGPGAVADRQPCAPRPTRPATMRDRVLGLVPRADREHVGPLDDARRLEPRHDQRGVAVARAARAS